MIDLAINEKGDLVLTKKEKRPRLEVDFLINNYPGFKLEFLAGKSKDFIPKNNSLKVNFTIKSNSYENSIHSIKDIYELQQRVMILLKTELGDIDGDQTFGTKIKLYKHLDITADETIQGIHDAIIEAIKGIIDEPYVEIIKEKQDESYFFCQNLTVYVYDGTVEIYEFEIEG